jgi:hypothetical protein
LVVNARIVLRDVVAAWFFCGQRVALHWPALPMRIWLPAGRSAPWAFGDKCAEQRTTGSNVPTTLPAIQPIPVSSYQRENLLDAP